MCWPFGRTRPQTASRVVRRARGSLLAKMPNHLCVLGFFPCLVGRTPITRHMQTTDALGHKQKRRRKEPPLCNNNNMAASGDDLPDEILYHMASFMGARQLLAVGGVCRGFRRVAHDPRLWRQLFMRDFAPMYAKNTVDTSQRAGYHKTETWPPEARFLYERADAAILLPPPCESTVGLPAPLARAFAMGKDWLWLYVAHARKAHGRSSGPGFAHCPESHQRLGQHEAWVYDMREKIVVGDWINGKRSGYGVAVELNKTGTVTAWRERFKARTKSWSVCHTFWCAHYRTNRFAFIERCSSGERAWRARGSRAVDGVADWVGATNVLISTDSNGAYVVKPLKAENEHGVVCTVFANGDIQRLRYVDGVLMTEGKFVCSPRCPDACFAGTILRCAWRRSHNYTLSGGGFVVPADPTSEAARLFWKYAERGLLGWRKYDIDQCIRERNGLLLLPEQ
ncbi:F-box domain protein [Pandoravirus inopinatum]|uniref:F-box domain protein n=1 Tax=Pandoravirus inopinatum TaxID=1605721 RepID=A0A0B5J6R0_9VIRU|nr:F-box domain protein [Pandoravirus inopinatum]AJF97465.1 F-box domain protein [Pandoravirus inopinatum]